MAESGKTTFEWNKAATLAFIDLLKQHPCLWKVNIVDSFTGLGYNEAERLCFDILVEYCKLAYDPPAARKRSVASRRAPGDMLSRSWVSSFTMYG